MKYSNLHYDLEMMASNMRMCTKYAIHRLYAVHFTYYCPCSRLRPRNLRISPAVLWFRSTRKISCRIKHKGGLPAALFKPRTVKGTASQATPPGRCLAHTLTWEAKDAKCREFVFFSLGSSSALYQAVSSNFIPFASKHS